MTSVCVLSWRNCPSCSFLNFIPTLLLFFSFLRLRTQNQPTLEWSELAQGNYGKCMRGGELKEAGRGKVSSLKLQAGSRRMKINGSFLHVQIHKLTHSVEFVAAHLPRPLTLRSHVTSCSSCLYSLGDGGSLSPDSSPLAVTFDPARRMLFLSVFSMPSVSFAAPSVFPFLLRDTASSSGFSAFLSIMCDISSR